VREAALKIDEKLEIYTMGSYRRGAETCGDVFLYNAQLTIDRSDIDET
jgi:hypothetical protein